MRAAGVVAQGLCDVVVAVESEDADGGVAEGGHDLGAVADADLGVVFGVGDVAHPVQAVLDRPVESCRRLLRRIDALPTM